MQEEGEGEGEAPAAKQGFPTSPQPRDISIGTLSVPTVSLVSLILCGSSGGSSVSNCSIPPDYADRFPIMSINKGHYFPLPKRRKKTRCSPPG